MYRNHWMSCSATIKTYNIMPCCTYLCAVRVRICLLSTEWDSRNVNFHWLKLQLVFISYRKWLIILILFYLRRFGKKTNQTNLNANGVEHGGGWEWEWGLQHEHEYVYVMQKYKNFDMIAIVGQNFHVNVFACIQCTRVNKMSHNSEWEDGKNDTPLRTHIHRFIIVDVPKSNEFIYRNC